MYTPELTLKIERARKHLDDLTVALNRWIKDHLHSTKLESLLHKWHGTESEPRIRNVSWMTIASDRGMWRGKEGFFPSYTAI